MSTHTTRTIDDRLAGVTRMTAALGRDSTEWEPDHLIALRKLEVAIDHLRDHAITAMREHGTTDAEIGDALGITRQAVSKRWPGGGRYVGAAGRYRKSTL